MVLDKRFAVIFLLALGAALFLNGFFLYNLGSVWSMRVEIWLGLVLVAARIIGIWLTAEKSD